MQDLQKAFFTIKSVLGCPGSVFLKESLLLNWFWIFRQKKGLGPGPRSPGIGGKHGRDLSLDKDKIEKDKKKDLDRLKKDLSELTERPTEAKRSRLDSRALSSSSHTPSPTPSRGEIDMSDGASEGGDFGDMEMNLEDQFDCSCCVCKTFTQVGSGLIQAGKEWNIDKMIKKYITVYVR